MSFIFFYVLLKMDRLRLHPLIEVIGADFMEFGKELSISKWVLEEIQRTNVLKKHK